MKKLRRFDLVHINKTLKEAGLKSTPQRAVILSYLVKSKSHPSAETIFRDLKKEYPSISLNTVYQTIETFEKKRMLFAIIDTSGSRRYDAHTEPHMHLICLKCGKITDIPYDDRRIMGKVKTKFKAVRSVFCVYGYCEKEEI